MKMLLLIILSTLLISTFYIQELKAQESANNDRKQAPRAMPDSNGNYRLVVSFASRSSGPDREGLKKINELIKGFENRYKTTILYNIGHYGREGETDYSFDLAGLKKYRQNKFIKKIKLEMAKFQLVSIEENAMPMSEKMKRK